MLHLGYEVWIEDERKNRIAEYSVHMESEGGTTITCYIPSESGRVRLSHIHLPSKRLSTSLVYIEV